MLKECIVAGCIRRFWRQEWREEGKGKGRGSDASQEKVPVCSGAGWGENFTGGWTKGLLLVENSVSHQGVTLLHTD
jgi:hypothetical protein